MCRIITIICYVLLPWAVMAQTVGNEGVTVGNEIADDSTLVAGFMDDSLAIDTTRVMPWEEAVKYRMETLLQSELFKTTQVGLMVWDLTADSALFAYNHQQRMRPASTMKLLTSITALDLLGGNHQFTTELRYRGKIEGHTLWGDLQCVGGMDPSFDNGDLKMFIDRIRMAGIDTIRGRIVADKSWKDDLLLGEGWCWDDDNPVLSALLVGRKDNFVERLERELNNVGVVFAFANDSISSSSPKDGGGGIIASCSHSLDHILNRMMKQSDNLYAESVFYHIGAAAGRPATAKNARAAVKRLISRLGFDAANYTVADGSGLSLYNYVSPELLVAFLRYAHQKSNIAGYLRPSLPTAGADGTLQSRMKGTKAQYNVRAKTGTLTGISSLAGYLFAPNGHDVCFAIINQGVISSRHGKAFQDRVCVALCTPSE